MKEMGQSAVKLVLISYTTQYGMEGHVDCSLHVVKA